MLHNLKSQETPHRIDEHMPEHPVLNEDTELHNQRSSRVQHQFLIDQGDDHHGNYCRENDFSNGKFQIHTPGSELADSSAEHDSQECSHIHK